MKTQKKGFVALMTAVILTIILITVAVTINRVGFLTRGEALDAEYKNKSLALAESCADKAMLKLAQNPTYLGNETITIGSDNCTIRPINPATDPIVIETQAIFQQATTDLRVKAGKTDLVVVFWDEVASF